MTIRTQPSALRQGPRKLGTALLAAGPLWVLSCGHAHNGALARPGAGSGETGSGATGPGRTGPGRTGPGENGSATEGESAAIAVSWSDAITSPSPVGRGARATDRDAPTSGAEATELRALLPRSCKASDAALERAAERLALFQATVGAELMADQVEFLVRASGAPYVWVKAWSLAGTEDPKATARRLETWAARFREDGVRRCGIGRAALAEGPPVTAALAVDVLGDLAPISTRVSVGEAVQVKAHFIEPVTDARVVVLGPRGAPRTLTTALEAERATAKFRADQPGRWLVQVIATVSGGPRPILEAETYAGVEPPKTFHPLPAPGEQAGRHADASPVDALRAMVNAARRSEGRKPLHKNRSLDRLAQEHAEAMRDARRLGHDLDAGNAGRRVEDAGVPSRRTGENIAAADSVERGHRALWASPSHRGNLLDRGYNALGVGIAEDETGRLWIVEIFADLD